MAYYTRAQWGASPPLKAPTPWGAGMPNSLTVHAVGANVGLKPDYLTTVKSIQTHAFAKGLSDIDYNYLVDYQGNIYEGRIPGSQSGAQGVGNTSSLAVCYLDNGDGDVPFTDAAKLAILSLLAQHVHGTVIHPHRDWNTPNVQGGHPEYVTSCPGNEIAAWCANPGVTATASTQGAFMALSDAAQQQLLDSVLNIEHNMFQGAGHSLLQDIEGMIAALPAQIAAAVAAKLPAGSVDTATIAKATADELAKRLVS